MLDVFTYDFMQRAFIAGLLVSLALPLLGSDLVARRYSMIADSLAHVSLAGVGLALALGTAPVAVALPVAVGGSLLLEYLRGRQRLSGETALAILMSGGLAVAVVAASLAKGQRSDFSSYLFGSIATTTWSDVWLLAAVAVLVVGVVTLKWRDLLHAVFDEDSARISGVPVGALNYLVVALTAAVVVLALRSIGGLLMSSLLVIPVVAASRLARGFRQTQVIAVLVAMLAVVGGLMAAFYFDLPAGGAIVLTALAILGAILAFAP